MMFVLLSPAPGAQYTFSSDKLAQHGSSVMGIPTASAERAQWLWLYSQDSPRGKRRSTDTTNPANWHMNKLVRGSIRDITEAHSSYH